MDKHNKQQKNKNNGVVKTQSPQASASVLPDAAVVREDAALKGKKPVPPAAKKK